MHSRPSRSPIVKTSVQTVSKIKEALNLYGQCIYLWGLPDGTSGKEPTCQCRRHKRQERLGFSPWVRKIPWRRGWQPTPVFLPGESRGQRRLMGYSLWGHKELDTTECMHASRHKIRAKLSKSVGMGRCLNIL